MNPIAISLGNFQIRYYSLFILSAVLIGFLIFYKESKRFKINKDFISNLFFWTLVAGFIGARLYYVIFNLEYYSANPGEIIAIWQGGLAIHGGIIGGFLAILIYTKKYQVSTLKMLDMGAPAVLIGQAVGRWGNFFNGEAHGAATTLTKLKSLYTPNFIIQGMKINDVYYLPTFFYESIWCVIGFIMLLIIRRSKYIKVGQIIYIYLMWYSFGRFFIEVTRTDALMFGAFRVAQLVSITLFLTGLIGIILSNRKSKFEDLYNSIEGEIRY